jgi:hypothetical protein
MCLGLARPLLYISPGVIPPSGRWIMRSTRRIIKLDTNRTQEWTHLDRR